MASVDILLPFYGDVGLMQLAVQSVLRQTDEDWQLIVVDDNYPDATVPKWFEALGDSRVTYHRNERNLGANANYARALSLSEARHIVFMGADDVMLPNYLSVIRRAFAQHPETAVVQPGVAIIDGHGVSVRPLVDRMKSVVGPSGAQAQLMQGEALGISLLRGNWTYFPSLAWDRDVVVQVGFRAGLNVTQDLALLMDLAKQGHQLVSEPTPAFLYRRHGQSDSTVRGLSGSRFEEERSLFQSLAEECRQLGWSRAARVARYRVLSRLNALATIPGALRRRDRVATRTLMRHVFL